MAMESGTVHLNQRNQMPPMYSLVNGETKEQQMEVLIYTHAKQRGTNNVIYVSALLIQTICSPLVQSISSQAWALPGQDEFECANDIPG
jgi:hypothetical protein